MAKHRESPIKRVNPSGKEVWVARYTGSDGRRRSAGTFRLKREAQDAIDAAHDRPVVADTVARYLERWLETRPRSERTDRTNGGRVRAVLEVRLEGIRLRDWDMRALRPRHRDELTVRMLVDQGRAPGGARNILRALSAMFEDAMTDELADVNPWKGARIRDDDRRARKEPRELRVWTLEQMHAFSAAASYRTRHDPRKKIPPARFAPAWEPMLRMLADCGLRAGELLALRRVDLDLPGGMLHVHGSAWEGTVTDSNDRKNHERDVPLAPSLATMLRAVPPRIDTPWLFPSPRGKLWRYSNWHRQIWQPTCEAAGIDPTPHEFRHSWVTHLRSAGVDRADLADVAGHGEDVATRVYSHALRTSYEQIRQAIG